MNFNDAEPIHRGLGAHRVVENFGRQRMNDFRDILADAHPDFSNAEIERTVVAPITFTSQLIQPTEVMDIRRTYHERNPGKPKFIEDLKDFLQENLPRSFFEPQTIPLIPSHPLKHPTKKDRRVLMVGQHQDVINERLMLKRAIESFFGLDENDAHWKSDRVVTGLKIASSKTAHTRKLVSTVRGELINDPSLIRPQIALGRLVLTQRL